MRINPPMNSHSGVPVYVNGDVWHEPEHGPTLLDHYAGIALPIMLQRYDDYSQASAEAYRAAEAMINQREFEMNSTKAFVK